MKREKMSANTSEIHDFNVEARKRGMTYGQYSAAQQSQYSSVRASIAEMKASGKYENYETRQRRKALEAAQSF